MQHFADALQRLPNARTLDAEAFYAEPRRFLKLAAAQLAVPMTDEDVETTVASPLFTTYSKNPQLRFNNEMRLERRAELEKLLASELEEALLWLEQSGGEQRAMEIIAAAALM
jgi:hypothetical protein